MTEVLFEGQCVPLESDQSALDGLLQAGFDIPHACQSGLCHSCVMQVDASQHAALGKLLNPEAQRGLSSAQLSRFEVLACQCRPKSRLALHLPGQLSVTRLATRVIHKRWLGEGVLGLTLERPQGYEYQAGQYLTLWHKEVGRCYSIASVPHLDQHLELHIRHYPDGALSTALLKYVAEGDTLHIQSPAGACYYQASKEQALLMLATGTGLAPVLGVLRDALSKGHTGPIKLVVAANDAKDFYALDQLEQLSADYANLHCQLVYLEGEAQPAHIERGEHWQWEQGDVYQFVQNAYPALSGWQIYLCGKDSFVKKLKRYCFLVGANMPEIFADSFVAAE